MVNPLPRIPVSLADVTIDDAFWTPRREVVRTQTIPQQEQQLYSTGRIGALALNWQPGEPEPHIFWESDIAKWIEAASYSLVHHPDPDLDRALDEVIARLAGAQQPDGYLNMYFSTVTPEARFTDLHDAHELYCLGHLVEAAVAHHQATGKTSLLDVVVRYLDLVEREFGPGGAREGGYCGHEEIELALVRLADHTGEQRWLELASRFIDARGTQPFFFAAEARTRGGKGFFGSALHDDPARQQRIREYNQSHAPVRQQDEAVGHSVRAMYLYCAMADLALRLGDADLRRACERLWESVAERKMYLTGGIGADASIEGFRGDYELPNEVSYNETCASIGLVMFAHRMALLTGQGRYLDVGELALYNTVLAGCSSDGTHYFYGNPMTSDGEHARQDWFDCACCPPNYARLLTSLEGYCYTVADEAVLVNLFVGGGVHATVSSGLDVQLTVETGYPWQGRVLVTVGTAGRFGLGLRIPGWAEGASASLNGDPVDLDVIDGFATITRDWSAGEMVVLELPLEPRRVWADPRVAADAGLVALRRGPLVHCIESTDLADAALAGVAGLGLDRDSELASGWHDQLAVATITATVSRVMADTGELYRGQSCRRQAETVAAIPYFAWGNRGRSAMRVWLRDLA